MSDHPEDYVGAYYIQRQEAVLVEFVRKSINLEIQVMSLQSAVKELEEKFAESQRQVEIQNDMMAQAAKGMESMKDRIDELEHERDDMIERIKNMEKQADRINVEKADALARVTELEDIIKNSVKETEELKKEYSKLNTELNEAYNPPLLVEPKNNKKKAVVQEKDDTF